MEFKESHNLIIKNVSRFIELTDLEKQKYISLLKEVNIKKRDFLLQAGDVARYEYFITKGCLKTYSIDEEGKQHISMFGIEDYWTTDMASFISGEPSHFFVEALEDTELLAMPRTKYDLLFQEIPKFERFYRILYQRSLMSYIRRSNLNISMTAEERYIRFMEQYPHIVRRIKQKDLAAYIGVTPEFISMIKVKIKKTS